MAACAPHLEGLCATSADCKAGETCNADGICLRQNTENGDAGDAGDGGDAGTPATTIDLLTPSSGATLPGHFHVSAQSDGTGLVTGIDFVVTKSLDDSTIGDLSVTSASGTVWAGDLTLSDGSFGGGAKVKAVMHRTGLADVTSSAVPVVIDQAAPSILNWDAGTWSARDAGLTVTATIADDRSSVASAALTLPDGGAYAGTLSGTTSVSATFQLAAADVVPAGAAAAVPFSLAATDSVGNRAALPDASVLQVDDAPPAIGFAAPDPSAWHAAAVDLSAIVTDPGAGLASVSIGPANGLPDAGSAFTFHVDVPAAMEGAVPLQLVAVDRVGNVSDAGFTILVDDVPPSVVPQIATSPDFVDGQSRGWFKAGAGTVAVSAEIDGGAGSPIASATAMYTGGSAGSSAPYLFDIPRALGAGIEDVQTVDIQAQDEAGNSSDAPIDIRFDGIAPSVSADPANAANTAWHSATLGNLSFTASATIQDLGTGVASATLGSVSGTASGNIWSFPSLQLPTSISLESAAYPVGLSAFDGAGNETDTTITFAVDNSPPVVSAVQIDTAFDGLDGTSQGWFQGPTACPACADIQVSAVISDGFLVGSSPVAIVGASSYSGTLVSGRWQFFIPRSVGLNASSAVAIAFDAQDQAGNHPVSPPGLSLQFDDVSAASFKPAITADTTWYGRSASVTPSVAVTLPAVPRSGVQSVELLVAAKPTVTCTKNTSTSYSCALPSTYAPSLTEAALNFTVTATSNSNVAPATNGSRNIDDVAPVLTASTISYPAAASGPLSWGHDGAHYTIRDSIPSTTFYTAYDCGAGVSTANSSMAYLPTPSTHALNVADSGARHACANGNNAIVYNVNVSANLGTFAAGAVSTLGINFSLLPAIQDAASGQTHTASSPFQNIAVTRALWKASPGTLSYLAVGPRVFASGSGGLYGFDLLTGAQSTVSSTFTLLDGIATNAGVPAVIYSQGFTVFAANASAGTANFGSCTATGIDDIGATGLASASSAVFDSDSITSVTGCTCSGPGGCTSLGDTCNTIACYYDGGANCTPHYTSYSNTLSLSGSSVSCAAGGSAASSCSGSAAGPTSLSQRIAAASPATLYVGSNGTAWVAANSAGSTLNAYGSTLSSPGWPLLDGSANAFLPGVFGTASRIDVVPLTTGGFGSLLYTLGGFGGSITDMMLGSNGILYVLAANTVYAVITDSTGGLSSQSAGWPSQCHDACRSGLAGYACSY